MGRMGFDINEVKEERKQSNAFMIYDDLTNGIISSSVEGAKPVKNYEDFKKYLMLLSDAFLKIETEKDNKVSPNDVKPYPLVGFKSYVDDRGRGHQFASNQLLYDTFTSIYKCTDKLLKTIAVPKNRIEEYRKLYKSAFNRDSKYYPGESKLSIDFPKDAARFVYNNFYNMENIIKLLDEFTNKELVDKVIESSYNSFKSAQEVKMKRELQEDYDLTKEAIKKKERQDKRDQELRIELDKADEKEQLENEQKKQRIKEKIALGKTKEEIELEEIEEEKEREYKKKEDAVLAALEKDKAFFKSKKRGILNRVKKDALEEEKPIEESKEEKEELIDEKKEVIEEVNNEFTEEVKEVIDDEKEVVEVNEAIEEEKESANDENEVVEVVNEAIELEKEDITEEKEAIDENKELLEEEEETIEEDRELTEEENNKLRDVLDKEFSNKWYQKRVSPILPTRYERMDVYVSNSLRTEKEAKEKGISVAEVLNNRLTEDTIDDETLNEYKNFLEDPMHNLVSEDEDINDIRLNLIDKVIEEEMEKFGYKGNYTIESYIETKNKLHYNGYDENTIKEKEETNKELLESIYQKFKENANKKAYKLIYDKYNGDIENNIELIYGSLENDEIETLNDDLLEDNEIEIENDNTLENNEISAESENPLDNNIDLIKNENIETKTENLIGTENEPNKDSTNQNKIKLKEIKLLPIISDEEIGKDFNRRYKEYIKKNNQIIEKYEKLRKDIVPNYDSITSFEPTNKSFKSYHTDLKGYRDLGRQAVSRFNNANENKENKFEKNERAARMLDTYQVFLKKHKERSIFSAIWNFRKYFKESSQLSEMKTKLLETKELKDYVNKDNLDNLQDVNKALGKFQAKLDYDLDYKLSIEHEKEEKKAEKDKLPCDNQKDYIKLYYENIEDKLKEYKLTKARDLIAEREFEKQKEKFDDFIYRTASIAERRYNNEIEQLKIDKELTFKSSLNNQDYHIKRFLKKNEEANNKKGFTNLNMITEEEEEKDINEIETLNDDVDELSLFNPDEIRKEIETDDIGDLEGEFKHNDSNDFDYLNESVNEIYQEPEVNELYSPDETIDMSESFEFDLDEALEKATELEQMQDNSPEDESKENEKEKVNNNDVSVMNVTFSGKGTDEILGRKARGLNDTVVVDIERKRDNNGNNKDDKVKTKVKRKEEHKQILDNIVTGKLKNNTNVQELNLVKKQNNQKLNESVLDYSIDSRINATDTDMTITESRIINKMHVSFNDEFEENVEQSLENVKMEDKVSTESVKTNEVSTNEKNK